MENEENKIQEGEVEESQKIEASIPKKKKRNDFYIELALFLILGILVGVAAKSEAIKRITIGFDDYKMNVLRQDYDINDLEKKLTQAQVEESQNQDQGSVPEGQAQDDNL